MGASEKSLSGETIKATAAKVAMNIIGFTGTIIFARVIGAKGLGDFYTVMAVAGVANQVTSGFSDAVQKRASELDADLGEIITLSLVVPILWTTILGTGAIVFQDIIISYIGFSRAPSAFIAVLLAFAIYNSVESLLTANGRIGRAAWIDAFRSAVTITIQVSLIFVGLGAAGIAYGFAIATLITSILLYKNVSSSPILPTWSTIHSLWDYAKYSSLTSYFGKLYSEFDILVIRAMLADPVAGYYGIASRVSKPGGQLSMVVSDGLYSQVSNLHSKGEAFQQQITNSMSFTSLFIIPMLVGGTLLRDPLIVTVFGSENQPTAVLLPGLLLFQLVRTQSGPLETVVMAMDYPDVQARITFAALLVNIILGIALTLVYQTALGVVAATLIAEICRYVLARRFVTQRVSGLPILPRPVLKQISAAGVMGMVTVFLSGLVTLDSWVSLSVVISLCAIIYFGVLIVVSGQFRTTVRSGLRSL